MNKILILISILLGSILMITNFAAGSWIVHIIIWRSTPWILAFVWIAIWFIAWFWVKWIITDKKNDNDEDWSGLNF